MKSFKLANEILSLSVSQIWDEAKYEWQLSYIYFTDYPDNCLCGHEINECCVLINILNKKKCLVGNVCVNKFLGIESEKIFNAVKMVKKDLTKSLNSDAIQYSYNQNWINDWEKEFYFNTIRKRKISEKQAYKRKLINSKIIYNISVKNTYLV